MKTMQQNITNLRNSLDDVSKLVQQYPLNSLLSELRLLEIALMKKTRKEVDEIAIIKEKCEVEKE